MHKSQSFYLIWQLLYIFRVLPPPILRSTKQMHPQHLVTITPYCYLLLSWKSWNWFGCVVGGVRHLQHNQISSKFSKIAADNSTVLWLPDAVDAFALCSWGWVVVTPEICRAVIRLNKNSVTCASSWNIYKQIITMHGLINIKPIYIFFIISLSQFFIKW